MTKRQPSPKTGLYREDGQIDVAYRPDFLEFIAPWCDWDSEAFLKGIRGLPGSQIAAYVVLLNLRYSLGRPLDQPAPHLARLCGLSPTVFRKAVEELLGAKRLIKLDAGLWDERVDSTLAARKNIFLLKSKAALSSHENRNKNNNSNDAQGQQRESAGGVTYNIEHLTGSGGKPPPPEAAGFADDLAKAVGMPAAPGSWHKPKALAEIERWRAMGLSDAAILDVAAKSREVHAAAPMMPQALTPFMEVATKSVLVPKRTLEDVRQDKDGVIRLWADAIREGRHVPASAVTPAMARAMVEQGLVEEPALRAAGVAL
jgi:hypothetical protein